MAGPESAVRRLIAEAADAARGTIRAYHGSPYDFDRFDASKIGTGEGAAAYGNGLYFAGNEDVARSYRDALRWRRQDSTDPAVRAAMWAHRHGGPADAVAALQSTIDNSMFGKSSWDSQLNTAAIEYLQSGGELPELPKGHMYQVEIGYPEESLLDYDRPFSSPPGVVSAKALREVYPFDISDKTLGAIKDGSWRLDAYDGRPYQNAAVAILKMASTRQGADALRAAGVPGIRYRDQVSRGSSGGTRNYVIFPGGEDRIQILRKYGLLPPLMAPAMMQDDQ
jgi:hypothetical protein